ncbi:MAG: phenylalanine--tRNA ligase subunit beta [Bacilli bacterium]|nr:phenylalanine--tRNA ligase subunit beta [Bacilli bacterium]
MKISLKWLKEFVNLDGIEPEVLASKLTFAGVEVESIDKLASGTNLVIGKILTCVPHPDSDHLHILNVDEGQKYGVHQIVCGAPNARVGLNVIVAREGAVLPCVTIEKGVIRGVESDGMCCSLLELGVDKKFLSEKQVAGIEELPEDAPVGEEDVLGYLGLDDVILDLSLLANRPDMYAMQNVAMEVGALLEREVKLPEYKEYSTGKSDFVVTSLTDKCKLFGGREIRNVVTKPSPKWMSDILTSMGVRSINNVVDIGNFVMLLTGQPINMYDADKLLGRTLEVREDFEGEYVAMDEQSYTLAKGDLVVSSNEVPMCLAGIMTSKACAVTEETKNVIIEAANFFGASIRRTSNRLGLASDSSSRFVKGLNAEQNEKVLRICSALMVELADAKEVLSCDTYDELPHEKKIIKTSLAYINGRLGTNFSKEEVVSTLTRDHIVVKELEDGAFECEVPYYRIDMGGEADISEEVIRLLGYENITSKLPEGGHKGGYSEAQKNKIAIRRFLRNEGLTEVLTYSLVDLKKKDAFEYIAHGENYRLINPLTDDKEYMRKNILASLLETAAYNYAHQNKDVAIYEISDVDAKGLEGRHLGIVLVGEESLAGKLERRTYDFYSVKGYLEGIFSLLNLNPQRFRLEKLKSDKEEFHPYRSAMIYAGKDPIAVLGELHPNKAKELGFGKAPVVALELNLVALLDMKTSEKKASVPPKFPTVTRDLAFVVSRSEDYMNIKREIMRIDRMIVDVDIFDSYQGVGIPSDKKSIALSLSFRLEDRTLKDEEVSAIMEKVTGMIKMKFNAEVRG